MSEQTEHQKLVDLTIARFQERGITCVDYETLLNHDDSKRPDLLLPDFDTFLEVKTFIPKQRERKEEQRIMQELVAGRVSASWQPAFFDRFGDDLSLSSKKFRVYPDYHTAVIIYDLHTFIHKPNPEELLLGQEYWEIAFPANERQNPVPVGYGRKKRQLRRDKNTEIGAVVFSTDRNVYKIFHHRFAEPIRRITPDIFALPEDEHFEYIDDSKDPQIVPLKC
jgi:hypothetical protein